MKLSILYCPPCKVSNYLLLGMSKLSIFFRCNVCGDIAKIKLKGETKYVNSKLNYPGDYII